MIKMTPQLRFPEFTDEWKIERLGQIVSFHRGGALSKDQLDNDGQYKAIHYGELFTKYNEVIKEARSKTNTNTGKISESGDLLMPTSDVTPEGLAKASAIYESGVMLGGDINVLRPNRIIDSTYLSYLINSQKKKVMRLVTGTTVRHVYASDIAKIYYGYPSLDEQQKIADFLTAVDDKISALKQKTEKLETYKRGVMQKIFSQQIRFKDENDKPYPDWKEKAVSEFLKERKEYTSKGGDLEHISLTTAGVVPKSERYERDFLVGSTDKQYRITRLDDICYNPANLKFGVIARNKYKDGIFSPIYVTYVVNNADIGFVEYLVTGRDFIQRARKYEQGTVYERMAVSPQDLAKVKVRMPVIEEQQKIATFLTALDDKLTAEKSKLTASRQFKKALLQRMFV